MVKPIRRGCRLERSQSLRNVREESGSERTAVDIKVDESTQQAFRLLVGPLRPHLRITHHKQRGSGGQMWGGQRAGVKRTAG